MITHPGLRRPIKFHLTTQQSASPFHEQTIRAKRRSRLPPRPWTYDNVTNAQLSPDIPAPPGLHAPPNYFPLYSRNRLAHKRWETRHRRPNFVPGLLPYNPEDDQWVKHGHSDAVSQVTKRLRSALRSGDPHSVLRSFVQLSSEANRTTLINILAWMPTTTFIETLRCLDPKHFVDRYHRLHEDIGFVRAGQLSLPQVDIIGHYKFCSLFLSLIRRVVDARRESYPFTILELRYLLRVARGVGNLQYAEDIWLALTPMGKGHLDPDIICYNDFMAVICWAPSSHPGKRRRLRNTAWNLAPRSWVQPPLDVQDFTIGARGTAKRVSTLFHQMVASGQRGNEETFSHMIIGLGREGDIPAVESILQRVWNVNVPELTSTGGNSDLTARKWPPDSQFYPSQQLLYSIAHCYGSNNDIPTALKIIDYISSQYSVMMSKDTWHELLRWAYVLSRPSSRPLRSSYKCDTASIGNPIPSDAVLNLFRTMVSDPYNIQPNVEMYNLAVRTALFNRKLRDAEVLMEDGRIQHKKEVHNLGLLMDKMTMLRECGQQDDRQYDKLSRLLHLQQLTLRKNRLTIRKWVEKLSTTNHSSSLRRKLTTMVSDPYNIQPNVEMYNLAVRTALFNRKLRDAEVLMEDGRIQHKKEVHNLGLLMDKMTMLRECGQQDDRQYDKLSRLLHLQQLTLRKNRLTIRKWVEKLSTTNHSSSLRRKLTWYARALPRLVNSWKSFMPYHIGYPIATGHVRFWTGSFGHNRAQVWRLRYGAELTAQARRNGRRIRRAVASPKDKPVVNSGGPPNRSQDHVKSERSLGEQAGQGESEQIRRMYSRKQWKYFGRRRNWLGRIHRIGLMIRKRKRLLSTIIDQRS
ncbi:hypothetical protein HYALB_00008999 [Hymenoscyphus albidus]|uniref:Pentatricopeptide repeat domain-containing protein n=1 Tax=Hymenoscyphus albidus TaxID=595503 RepID=A0A9N9PWV8_9HELO|nr:hypothetical protein HYALB_00008999 [Hymenoscyphus albidus]